jgi:hypothetical protein
MAWISFLDQNYHGKDLRAGEIYDANERFAWRKPGERGKHSFSGATELYGRETAAYATSFISAEHANKLAVEAYQKYLALKAKV